MRTSETLSPLGQLLRSARLSMDLTLENVGDLIDVNFRRIAEYEMGIRRPSMRRCIKLANVLGIPFADIMTRMEESR